MKAEKINDADQILLILPTARVFLKPSTSWHSRLPSIIHNTFSETFPQKLWNLVPKVVALPYIVCTKTLTVKILVCTAKNSEI